MIGLWQFIQSVPRTPAGDPEFVVTVDHTKVNSTLTDFPLMIRLQDMPSSFWDDVQWDGDNIRVYDDADNLIPHDVTLCYIPMKIGRVFCKITLSDTTDTVVKVKLLDKAVSRLSASDTNGRDNVWNDYDWAWIDGQLNENRGTTGTVNRKRGNVTASSLVDGFSTSDAGTGGADGIAADGSHIYLIEPNNIYKVAHTDYTTAVSSNTDPLGDAGNSADHILGGHVHSGELFVIEWTGSSNTCRVLVFDTATLTYQRQYTLTDNDNHRFDDLTFDGTNWWFITAANNSHIYKYDSSFTFVETVAFTAPGNLSGADTALNDGYGITYVDDYPDYLLVMNKLAIGFFVGTDGTANFDGNQHLHPFVGSTPQLNKGITWDNTNKHLFHNSEADSFVRKQKLADYPVIDYRRIRFDWQNIQFFGLGTTWTVGVSHYHESGDQNPGRPIIAVFDGSKTGIRANSDNIQLADDTANGSLNTGVTHNFGEEHRMVLKYDGTTARALWIDGVEEASDSPSVAVPTGDGDGWFDFGLWFNRGYGMYQWIWMRQEYMSDDWIEADYENWANPDTFYTVS